MKDLESVHYVRLTDGGTFPELQNRTPFKAVVIVDEHSSSAFRSKASKWLVAEGCLYMMAWGKDCTSWDDSVDHANLECFSYGKIPEDSFVMTTWHDDEALIDVFGFAKRASHPTIDLEKMVLVHVSEEDKRDELIEMFKDAT